jgi:tripartite-type tricarboxylate transporter receptor subunit TctC
MMRKKIYWVGIILIAISILNVSGQSKEQYPNKPITIIVPWAPGGLKPVLFEVLKPLLSKELGVPIITVNKTGGGGAVGWKELQVAKPDGYTIGAASNSIFGATFSTKGDVDYRNFKPIVVLTSDSAAITVNTNSPWKTFKEFFDYAKANPKKVRVGNSGAGGIWHIATMIINKRTGLELLPVPFTGGGPAVTALMGNHIEATSVTPGDMTASLPTGKLRILALASATRNPYYPDVPTVKESIGIEVVVNNWSGVIVHKDAPNECVTILANAFEKISKDPVYIEFFEKNRLTQDFQNNEQFKKSYELDAESMMSVLESLDK